MTIIQPQMCIDPVAWFWETQWTRTKHTSARSVPLQTVMKQNKKKEREKFGSRPTPNTQHTVI